MWGKSAQIIQRKYICGQALQKRRKAIKNYPDCSLVWSNDKKLKAGALQVQCMPLKVSSREARLVSNAIICYKKVLRSGVKNTFRRLKQFLH